MIAIAGGKGGCGKTTTTLAVARALHDVGIGARAVDLDAGMPDLHRMAGVERDPSLATVVDEERVAPVQRGPHGVEIVPAPRALTDLDVPDALDAVRPRNGVAFLDCPAGAGPAATMPLREADAAILVTTDRPESVEDAAKTGRMARRLEVPVLGAVVTRTERASRGVRAELAANRVVAVPSSGNPLDDARVRERYRSVAGWIETWLAERRESTVREERVQHANRRDEPAEGRAKTESSERCPHCGAERPTRRRDRRSRRSRGREGTRSSSRGGGAPSGPR